MWAHAHTDLTDFYRDRLTLRQIHVRIKALPGDCYLQQVLTEAAEKAKRDQDESDLLAILDKFKPEKG